MKAFILSAGLGTRLQPLTNDKPKVMVKIGGKPILEHLIRLCVHHRIRDIVINLHYLPRAVTEYFRDGKQLGVQIIYSYEKEKIMGGAGALRHAQGLLQNDTLVVINGDVMTNLDLTTMVQFHQQKDGLGTFFVHDTDHPYDSDLVEFDKRFLIKRFFRSKLGDQFNSISKSGAHIFEPRVLGFIPDNVEYSLEKQLIPDLLKKDQKLYAFYNNAYSKDIGTPERLVQVRQDYERGKISF